MTALEWQVASGSPTAHVIDVDQPMPRRGEPGHRKSGARALCKRYPQRNAEGVWWSYPVGKEADNGLRHYEVTRCPDCDSHLCAETDTAASRT